MGFSYLKGLKAGPFRVTASKSGISCSAGVEDIRVTKQADGHAQTTISAPGTGLHNTTNSGNRQNVATPTDTTAADSPAARRERRRWLPGAWYFAIVLLSAGVLTAIPFAHAASRLHRKGLWLRAGIYTAVTLMLGVLSSLTPRDAAGNTVGTAGHTLGTVVGSLAIALMAVGCFQLAALRREVYGLGAGPAQPAHPAAADPVVAARLAARTRRNEARSLAQSDPVLARDLHIGRPDLPREYDDGGLIDLNSAPAHTIATACSIDLAIAEKIVTARQELGSFSSLDEVFVFTQVEQGTAACIRDYALLLPR